MVRMHMRACVSVCLGIGVFCNSAGEGYFSLCNIGPAGGWLGCTLVQHFQAEVVYIDM